MVRTLFSLAACVLFAVSLASPQREDRGQLITSQQRQRVLQQQQQQQGQPEQRQRVLQQQQQQQQQRQLQQQQQQQQQRLPQQRQSQSRKINTLEQAQVPSLGIYSSRTDLHLPAIGDAELQRFLENEEAVTAMTQCFITPKQCSSKQDLKIIKQVRGLGPSGVCKTCTKEEQDKLHQLIYAFMQHYITRYPQLWRRVIPHLGNLITFALK